MADWMRMLGVMSLQAGFILVLILVFRKIFEKLHIEKKYLMFLWGISFMCLMCPWKINIPVGLWNSSPIEMTADKAAGAEIKEQNTGKKVVEQQNISSDDKKIVNTQYEQEKPLNRPVAVQKEKTDLIEVVLGISGYIWAAGLIVLALKNIIDYIKLRKILMCSMKIKDNIYVADNAPVPMVTGIFRTRIYIPVDLSEEYRYYVLAHENTHIKRHDVLFKTIVYVIACIHWFNPVVWFAFRAFSRDMEMTCDEETIRFLGTEKREQYATALLEIAVGKYQEQRMFRAGSIAFGEGNLKSRIKHIMLYRKSILVVTIGVFIICLCVVGICMTKGENTTLQNTALPSATPQNTTPPSTAPQSTSQKEPGKVRELSTGIKAENCYREFIERLERAFEDDFQSVSVADLDINEVYNKYVSEKEFILEQDLLGYKVVDIDSDDVPELLLGTNGMSAGVLVGIYDIYKYEDDKMIHVYSAGSEDDSEELDKLGGNFEFYRVEFKPFDMKLKEIEYQDSDDLQFSDLDGIEFMFSSGAGAWSTVVTIHPDGTFTGYYHDSNAGESGVLYPGGTCRECNFQGKFSRMQKSGDFQYTFKCEYLNVEGSAGEERIEDGIRYIIADPYGFDNADEFILYLPGKPADELPEGFLGWSHDKAAHRKLSCYGLYNVGGEQGFVVWDY